MLERFLTFLDGLGGGAKTAPANSEQLAATALMFAVMDADGVRKDAEFAKLRDLVSEKYGLAGPALSALVGQAQDAEAESVDLYQFTSTIVKLEEADRLQLITLLWEVVYADGELHEMEETVVWRIAELIGVSPRDRVEARQRVAARAKGPQNV
jgi:uncharacterized tellurite resistance protein B-like protein